MELTAWSRLQNENEEEEEFYKRVEQTQTCMPALHLLIRCFLFSFALNIVLLHRVVLSKPHSFSWISFLVS